MTSLRNKWWAKIAGKSKTKQYTLPTHLKTAAIKIEIISKGDKL
jgi:hypothetical protein